MKWKLFSRSKAVVPEPEAPPKTPRELLAEQTRELLELLHPPVVEQVTTEQRLKAMTYKELLQEFRVLCWQEKKLEREAKKNPPATDSSRKNPYQARGFRGYTLRKDIGYVWAEMETRPEHAKRSKFWKLSA